MDVDIRSEVNDDELGHLQQLNPSKHSMGTGLVDREPSLVDFIDCTTTLGIVSIGTIALVTCCVDC